MKWREISDVLSDKKIPMSLKGKFCGSVVTLIMLFGSKYWAIERKIKQTLNVTDMRTLK